MDKIYLSPNTYVKNNQYYYEDDLYEKGFNLVSENFVADYPKTFDHLMKLSKAEEFSSVIGTYLDWYKRKLQDSN